MKEHEMTGGQAKIHPASWRDAGWRDEESDDSSLGSVLHASAWADESEEEEDDEKMTEEWVAEVTVLDEILAEQESTEASSRLNDDSNLVLYQSPATEWRSEQTGLTPGLRTMIVSMGGSVIVTQGGSRGPIPNT